MKVLEKTALRAYVTWQSLLAARGQGSLEYVAIAVAIVTVIFVGFALFTEPIAKQTSCILDSINGSGSDPPPIDPPGPSGPFTC